MPVVSILSSNYPRFCSAATVTARRMRKERRFPKEIRRVGRRGTEIIKERHARSRQGEMGGDAGPSRAGPRIGRGGIGNLWGGKIKKNFFFMQASLAKSELPWISKVIWRISIYYEIIRDRFE